MDSFAGFFRDALNNFPFMVAVLSWAIAQCIKVFYYWIAEKDLDLWHLVEAGGMPSSHSALVCSLTAALGLMYGATSPYFAISFIFAVIVMYDAMGVRRLAGKQALILNRMIEKGMIKSEKLRELIGHSPLEVFFGFLLGVGITITLYLMVY